MKKSLTIASFNMQNPNMKKTSDEQKTIEELIKIIRNEEIDILCCQEVLEKTVKSLEKELSNYQIVAFYRYGNNIVSKHLSLLKRYNEATPIITKLPILSKQQHRLPWFPKKIREIKNGISKYRSITPRIITETIIKIDNQYSIKILNTHLEKRIKSIKKKQLKKIEKYISKSMCPTILTGDFNMGIDDLLLQEFEKNLQKKNMKRVEWNHKSWKYSKKNIEIDQIFIPNDFSVIEQRVVDNDISDHYMLMLKIKLD